jgi:RNA polymerase sigma factor (sigma-70 family)
VTRLVEITIPPELLAQACAGDAAARRTLYIELAPATLTLIRRIVGRGGADDLFQDTMMIFFERLAQYRNEAPLGAWLRQIAISRCFMHLRSPWRRLLPSLDPESFADALQSTALVSPAWRAEAIDLERALASLAPTARAVVWMYEVEGYTHQEIAREFGRTVSFSKSQLARAHVRLRAWFEPRAGSQSCTLI